VDLAVRPQEMGTTAMDHGRLARLGLEAEAPEQMPAIKFHLGVAQMQPTILVSLLAERYTLQLRLGAVLDKA
jgi:hypothetical protein